MVGIGIGEMILIAGIALVVFGPEKFPDFAKIVLRTVRDLRGYVDDIQSEISKEIKPIKRELDQMSKYDPEKYVNALAKDVTGDTKKKTAAKPVAAKDKGAADPTDRQDDSFDYDDGSGYNHPDADPYAEQKTPEAEKTENAAAPVDPQQPEEASAQDAASDGTAAGDSDTKDAFDFTEPPVERLD